MKCSEFVVMSPGIDVVGLAEENQKESYGNTCPDAGIADTEVKAYCAGKSPENNLSEVDQIKLGNEFEKFLHISPRRGKLLLD